MKNGREGSPSAGNTWGLSIWRSRVQVRRHVWRLTCSLPGDGSQHALKVVAPFCAVALPAGFVGCLPLRLFRFGRAAKTSSTKPRDPSRQHSCCRDLDMIFANRCQQSFWLIFRACTLQRACSLHNLERAVQCDCVRILEQQGSRDDDTRNRGPLSVGPCLTCAEKSLEVNSRRSEGM